ncbi:MULTISPECIES: type I methionyl aminopeptidase [Xanthomonas]|uniref:Methionine aminopeptidase n=1 Tax=Xanthomonas rydalmerensis TaxID=3046274 RepID=A0ABZ0JNZ9_9XANT|nr:type I methionyl aminopeptidase [Xanthomonas sp. DM-2023]MXV06540.1 type I methionyl aminopeptidase [Xanthomonas sp. LMG 9002]WOS41546.1 type I methionyl aminopeptidase [Xanthomonas sp. DM-2023]WOS45731.1 type I methionyl aminopeptidase [Xanthomonas sp. DM-2023]WOS49911.1 type I methionyl aminopeptidase [Xanthomonas sp. DM-2023]WOS54090.1 type I methionyl aminopeptidase [Xanthomonas sp. DM-2023]
MIKRPDELALLAESGRLLAQVFARLDGMSLLSRSTLELNDLVERMIVDELGARPASKGQYGFPFVLNASIDDVVCHGVPSADDVLRHGQIVNLDITLEKHGYIADSSTTYLVGEVGYPARRLVQAAYQAMWKGIAAVRPGARLGDIGHAIARHARAHGYTVVKEYCGHGIGRAMHEEPQILHYGHAGTGLELREGMVFTIEPMLNQGRAAIRALPEQWPVHTRDGKLSAQFEHTVAVTASGVRVLTLRPGEVPLCRME